MGIVEDDEILQLSSNFIAIVNNELNYDGVRVKYNDVKILEPVVHSKVVNLGWTCKGDWGKGYSQGTIFVFKAYNFHDSK